MTDVLTEWLQRPFVEPFESTPCPVDGFVVETTSADDDIDPFVALRLSLALLPLHVGVTEEPEPVFEENLPVWASDHHTFGWHKAHGGTPPTRVVLPLEALALHQLWKPVGVRA